MKNAFEPLFQMSNPRKHDKLQTDAGKEFLNKDVQKSLKSHVILHFHSHRDKKEAVVERFNRTLKTKIFTYFTAKHRNIYIDKLQDFVKSYNHSVHRMIGMRPAEDREKDQVRVWARQYGNNLHRPRKPSLVEDIAKISKIERIFEKTYVPNWSDEDFRIKSRIPKRKPVFKLADDLGDDR